MSTVALYRKFRPTVFEEVKGQDAIVRTLRNQLKTDRIGHAYLFTGTRGTGKTTVAKIFARAVNCLEPEDGNPCNECEHCTAAAQGNFMDIVEIDAASNTGVDDIRRVIEEIQYTPAKGRYKVYIIDEAHMLSGAAFNAFLKTLEEPPKYVIFILATTEPHKLPITILSRCQRYDFRRIDTDTISENLRSLLEKEGIEAEEKAIVYIAKCADGSMRDAISLLDKCIAFSLGEPLTYNGVLTTLGVVDTEVFSHIFRYVTSSDAVAALTEFDRVVSSGKDVTQFVADFIWYLRNLLLTSVGGGDRDVLGISEENMEILNEDAKIVDSEIIMRYIRILSELLNQLRQSATKQVLVEVALIKLAKPQTETDNDSILDRVRQLEDSLWEELSNARKAVEELNNRAAVLREKVAIATFGEDRELNLVDMSEEPEEDDFAPVGTLEIVTGNQDEDDLIGDIIEGKEEKEETDEFGDLNLIDETEEPEEINHPDRIKQVTVIDEESQMTGNPDVPEYFEEPKDEYPEDVPMDEEPVEYPKEEPVEEPDEYPEEPEGIKTFGNLFGNKAPAPIKPSAPQRANRGSLYFDMEEPEPVFDNSRAMLNEFLSEPLEKEPSKKQAVEDDDFDDLNIEEISFEEEAFTKNRPQPGSFAEIAVIEWDKVILGCIDPALRVTLNKCTPEVTGPESIVIKANGVVSARFLRSQDTITYVKEIIKEVVGRDIDVTVEQAKLSDRTGGRKDADDVFAGIDMDIETEDD